MKPGKGMMMAEYIMTTDVTRDSLDALSKFKWTVSVDSGEVRITAYGRPTANLIGSYHLDVYVVGTPVQILDWFIHECGGNRVEGTNAFVHHTMHNQLDDYYGQDDFGPEDIV